MKRIRSICFRRASRKVRSCKTNNVRPPAIACAVTATLRFPTTPRTDFPPAWSARCASAEPQPTCAPIPVNATAVRPLVHATRSAASSLADNAVNARWS
jgi:hypothetical protein